MPDPHPPSPFLTLTEAAAYLRLAPRTLDNMRQRGTGPIYSKHGGRVRYHRQDLNAWVNDSRRRTTTERAGPLVLQAPATSSDPKSVALDCARISAPARTKFAGSS